VSPLRPGMIRNWVPFQEEVPFNPDDIAGLLGWYKADALSLGDGDPVTTWTDSSGNGEDASGTAVYQTNELNGLPVVQFDGVDDFLTTTSFSAVIKPVSLFAVVNPTSFAAYREIVAPTADRGLGWRVDQTTGKQTFSDEFNVDIGTSTTGLTATAFQRVAVTYSGSGVFTFYLNGVEDGTGTNNQTFTGASMIQIGTTHSGLRNWLGYIAEILIYDSVLSADDRGAVDAYLADKWGL
jgi:hypothetical protein